MGKYSGLPLVAERNGVIVQIHSSIEDLSHRKKTIY